MWKFIFRAALGTAIVAGVIVGILRAFFVTPVNITHNGMAPTLLAGEQAYMWRGGTPELGAIVLCTHPSTGEAVIGRVVGIPGVTIATEREQLTVDGRTLDIDYLESITFQNSDTGRQENVQLAEITMGNTTHDAMFRDNYRLRITPVSVSGTQRFLMGDNRADDQHDSRAFGTVDANTCLGTLFMRGEPRSAVGIDHGWLDLL